MSESTQKPVKVLFLSWGYSIHAFRRISIFANDPRFQVSLVSNHQYAIEGVKLYPLYHAKSISPLSETPDKAEEIRLKSLFGIIAQKISQFAIGTLLKDLVVSFIDCKKLFQAYREVRPDVIFLQTLLYPCYLAYALPKKTPVIVTFWNGDVIWWAKWDGIERFFKKQIVTWGVRRACAVTVNSKTAFDACLVYGAVAEKIHLIRYPGVDLERFYPCNKAKVREKIGIIADKLVFAPRGLGGYLNSDVIIKAAALVIKEMPEVVFVISYTMENFAQLEEHKNLASELDIAANCNWVHRVDWEEMPDYYNAANVIVSISSNDSLPNCIMEAMACGVPVIAGDIPQLAELVTEGVTGYLVPTRNHLILAQRILTVLQNREQIADMLAFNALELIGHTVDSRNTIPMIKQLVMDTAKEA